MIKCKNVCKRYGKQDVLTDFSYTFPDKGFVLLFGESGCGKTTLLNILSGVISFEQGSITYGIDSEFFGRVDEDIILSNASYITQNAFLISQLTVFENIRLVCDDEEKIRRMLKKFKCENISDRYPENISGGERQRIAIIIAIINEKKILFLDEPTSALDGENKINLFEILNELKERILIICSSHDADAKKYADEIIYMPYVFDDYIEKFFEHKSETMEKQIHKAESHKVFNAFKLMKKYPNCENRSDKVLFFVCMVVFLIVGLCDTPAHKCMTNAKDIYKMNQLSIFLNYEQRDFIDVLSDEKGVMATVLTYSLSIPIEDDEEEGGSDDVGYNVDIATLPIDENALTISNLIKYGSYFTSGEQVLLSYETAVNMGNPENLLGEMITIKFPDGEHHMEIIGICRELSDFEREYLGASNIDADCEDLMFISESFSEQTLNVYGIKDTQKVNYTVYFENYNQMYNCYEKYKDTNSVVISYGMPNVKYEFLFKIMCIYMYPVAIVSILVCLLFCYQNKRIDFIYNRNSIAMFLYYGYSVQEVKKAYIKETVVRTSRILLVSLSIDLLIMYIVNVVNKQCVFVVFRIFTPNVFLIVCVCMIYIFFSMFIACRVIKTIDSLGWYSIISTDNDLL